MSIDLEYQCKACEVRLDPLMTKSETQYFFDNGCLQCGSNDWKVVE